MSKNSSNLDSESGRKSGWLLFFGAVITALLALVGVIYQANVNRETALIVFSATQTAEAKPSLLTSSPTPTDTAVPTLPISSVTPFSTFKSITATESPASQPIPTSDSIPTILSTPLAHYPPVILNEPQNGQAIRDFKVVFEWKVPEQKLASGDSYQIFYKLITSSDWQYTSDRIASEMCTQVICSKELRPLLGGYGKYVWTVFVVDRNGIKLSEDSETRIVDWIDPRE